MLKHWSLILLLLLCSHAHAAVNESEEWRPHILEGTITTNKAHSAVNESEEWRPHILEGTETTNSALNESEEWRPRIYEGIETTNKALGGYVVQVYYYTKSICTGGLLTERHFLTAAHCFEKLDTKVFHVVVGETYLRQSFSDGHRNHVDKVRIHPDFDKFNFIADIAVVKTLRKMVGQDVGYAPICKLPLYGRDRVIVAGWGENGGFSGADDVLRYMRVPIVSKAECDKKLERHMPPNVLCASAYNKKTLCVGDSGGPLVFRGQLCGVSTWTWKCGDNKKPDVYMSVYYYRKFVHDTIKELGYK